MQYIEFKFRWTSPRPLIEAAYIDLYLCVYECLERKVDVFFGDRLFFITRSNVHITITCSTPSQSSTIYILVQFFFNSSISEIIPAQPNPSSS